MRPEHLLAADAEQGFATIVDVIEPVGSDVHAYLRLGAQALVARLPPEELPAPGSTLRLRMAPTQLHWFDPVDGVAVARR